MDWEEFHKSVDLIKGSRDKVEDLLSLVLWCQQRVPKTYKDYVAQEIEKITSND